MSLLGERLKKEREKRGWTKTYVAKKLGIKGVSTYANWEYGLRDPDTDTLARLAELFEVSIDYLKGLDDVPMVRESQAKYIINDQARNAVIEEYLRLPPRDRKIVDDIIKSLSEKHKK